MINDSYSQPCISSEPIYLTPPASITSFPTTFFIHWASTNLLLDLLFFLSALLHFCSLITYLISFIFNPCWSWSLRFPLSIVLSINLCAFLSMFLVILVSYLYIIASIIQSILILHFNNIGNELFIVFLFFLNAFQPIFKMSFYFLPKIILFYVVFLLLLFITKFKSDQSDKIYFNLIDVHLFIFPLKDFLLLICTFRQ